jgi:hypothetical protein
MFVLRGIIGGLVAVLSPMSAGSATALAQAPRQSATRLDGSRVDGRLIKQDGILRFAAGPDATRIEWSDLAVIEFASPSGDPEVAREAVGVVTPGRGGSRSDADHTPPPFRLELGHGQAISGSLEGIDSTSIRFRPEFADESVSIQRGGVVAVLQRPGQARVLAESFEAIDPSRWHVEGSVDVIEEPRILPSKAAKLKAGGSSLAMHFPEPIDAGRIELAFLHERIEATGNSAVIEFVFEGPNGPETIQAQLGWGGEYPGAISRGGPSLVIQPLVLEAGWHRLAFRFRNDRALLSIDGDELARGGPPSGPLVELRIRTETSGKATGPDGLALLVADLNVVRLFEPSSGSEIDPAQDELRLVEGDQIWGQLTLANDDGPTLLVDERHVPFSWSEVAGIYFARVPAVAKVVEGPIARVEWSPEPGSDELDSLEGAIVDLTEDWLVFDAPYLGHVRIPLGRIRRLKPMGAGLLAALDVFSHHLGDQPTPELDPVLPESDRLEMNFSLDVPPDVPASLRVDVLDVEGDYDGGRAVEAIRKGELVTEVSLNGQSLGTLNAHVKTSNKVPEQIEMRIPAGILKAQGNRLSFVQKGRADKPSFRDDLGILGVSLHWPSSDAR